MPDGDYEMEDVRVRKADGGIWRVGEQILSGAARMLNEDVEIVARLPEPGIETALTMATDRPASLLGMEDEVRIAVGNQAILAVWHWDGTDLTLAGRIGF